MDASGTLPMPDGALVRAALAGDLDAFGVLVARYEREHFRVAVRLVGCRDDAHDALQSAFVRAHRHLARCEDPARVGAWLYRIVVNECRTLAARRARRERRLVRDEAVLGDVLGSVGPSEDGALREEIERALAQLPHDHREAFVLKYVEDRSYEEMTELTGAGVSALKMRVKRACERLRTLLEAVPHD
jgi:RNA polymerase sigma-70 factor (ECF subfamily)